MTTMRSNKQTTQFGESFSLEFLPIAVIMKHYREKLKLKLIKKNMTNSKFCIHFGGMRVEKRYILWCISQIKYLDVPYN